ncbi:anaerobic sulfatase maturase (plasmid) [Fulvitalea axinellae]|uniref:Anaerobic sulfatase maturase n=1 Tax=Fulvitalea axinellae TaxID=1182444 RepID=A0AAU9DCP4_9BACT|nr:anaerobic sulfatase maturase [Fulvitalea axinellae]
MEDLTRPTQRPKAFHIMSKPMGPICNLDCTYCYYLEKENLYSKTDKFRMSGPVLEEYIRQNIESQEVPVVEFAWQGGEPTLLGVDYFRKVVELQKKYANGKQITNAFQTNGTLLNDEWGEFFAKEQFLIGLSVDGPEELHDPFRYNKGGKGSFEQVMRGLGYLKKHGAEFNTLTVVNSLNQEHPLKVYNFLKEIGSTFMQFIPIVERIADDAEVDLQLVNPTYKGGARVAEWSVDGKQYGVFLSKIFDEWVRKDVGKHFVQIVDIALSGWLGMEPPLCIFKKDCGEALVMEHNGDVYSCDHFVYPEYKLGNILERPLHSMVWSKPQKRFGEDKSATLTRQCQDCEVRFVCNGGCPKNRVGKSIHDEFGQNYLCEGYYHFFKHIDPYMRFMANELRNERPPANVMEWVRAQDQSNTTFIPPKPKQEGQARAIGRNSSCPCGSGKRYKRCCGKK